MMPMRVLMSTVHHPTLELYLKVENLVNPYLLICSVTSARLLSTQDSFSAGMNSELLPVSDSLFTRVWPDVRL